MKKQMRVQVGACVAHLLSTQAGRLLVGEDGGGKRRHSGDKGAVRSGFSEADMRDLVTVGAAAGISACFRAPVRLSSRL
jgi:H+/Cl- antiporter ClcA